MIDQLRRAEGRAGEALRAGQHVAVGLRLLELISADAENTPCVVIVDDAHLVDAESLRALLFACRRLVASRALVVMAMDGARASPEPGSAPGVIRRRH